MTDPIRVLECLVGHEGVDQSKRSEKWTLQITPGHVVSWEFR